MTRGSNTRCHLMRLTREIKCTRRCTSFYQGRSAQNRTIVTSLCASSSVMKSSPAKVVLVVDRPHNIVLGAGLVISLLFSTDIPQKRNELATAVCFAPSPFLLEHCALLSFSSSCLASSLYLRSASSIKALLRLYEGSIKALCRLY